ncbi:putative cupin superfamily protein [Devosia sp. UYZn731]|uniref:cupin domain-containing protein n=1 Tax=Devosia sp. UYZn731 TaxID=3156345 RepID=UPI00339AE0F2
MRYALLAFSIKLFIIARASTIDEPIMSTRERPDFIANISERLRPLDSGGFDDLKGLGFPLGRELGLTRIGIHYEIAPPGCRSSFPHAESDEDEFVLVLKGTPDVWVDGDLYELFEGDAVAFPHGTGIAHTFLNNSNEDVHLLIIGEAAKAQNKISYPLNPERMAEFATHGKAWTSAPVRKMGKHDGKARAGSRVAHKS